MYVDVDECGDDLLGIGNEHGTSTSFFSLPSKHVVILSASKTFFIFADTPGISFYSDCSPMSRCNNLCDFPAV